MSEFQQLPPLALYIHIPWCVKKCPYCDFNSHTFEQLPEQEYLRALQEDLQAQLPSIWGRRIVSVFIGGGTPSLFSAAGIDQLLSMVRSHLNCLPNMEVTMEANPGTVEQDKFNGFYQAGVNRLSIGVQSFDDVKLQALGRIHSADEALRAFDVARTAGFENINLDLMYGLPGQSLEAGLADLRQAIALQPEHISWYQLTIEPNTLFHARPPSVPDDEMAFELQQQGQALLAEQGYQQYEISAYAREGRRCQHNLNYWQFGDYLALGAGAHGKISRSDNGQVQRYWQLRQPAAYMQASATEKISAHELIEDSQLAFEFMLNALRLREGFSLQDFEAHTGLSFSRVANTCEKAVEKGLLEKWESAAGYQATQQGYLFLNDLVNLFDE